VPETSPSVPAADLLVRRLVEHGVRHVFGYPGGQLTPVYDALYREPRLRHYLARHEQAACFMADGFARATGRPGVCLAVCGPGFYNAATPLASAHTDSTPVLLVSGQVASAGKGLRSGSYHENEQIAAARHFTRAQVRVEAPEGVVPALDAAWHALTSDRPGPVLFEAPVNVLRGEVTPVAWPPLPAPSAPRAPAPAEVEALARLLSGWKRPLILAGGGVVSAGAEAELARLAERLGAPVLHTAMGKCALPSCHPLAAGLPWTRATADLSNMGSFFSPLLAAADGLLAVGCRFTQLATGSWLLKPPPALAQIDVDPKEIGRHYPVTLGMNADAGAALRGLLAALPEGNRAAWAGRAKPQAADGEAWRLPGIELLGALRRRLPADGIISADVTRLAYILMAEFPLDHPRTFLHPAGAVAMGFGIPAALGAKAAFPERAVVAVVGDGGFMMSGMELATAVQERLPVVVVLVNDNSLTLIRATQHSRYADRFIAVDLRNPDFGLFARAFGVAYHHAADDADFERALGDALGRDGPTVIEVRPGDAR
jgi:acetolactate synthase-1/2/3 large subunit